MDDGGQDFDFGAELRAATETLATEIAERVAKAAVEAQTERFGAAISQWATTAAERVLAREAASLVSPVVTDLAIMKGAVEAQRERLGVHHNILRKLDTDRIEALATEVESDQARLRKQRAELAADLAAATERLAAAEQAAAETVEIRKALADEFAKVLDTVEARSREAAEAAIGELRADVLVMVDHFGTELTKVLADRLTSKGKTAAMDTGDLIVPTGFSGPWQPQAYERGNMVISAGATWIAKRKTADWSAGPADGDDWQLFASGGFRKG